jgi:uncharacterized membrane protein
MSVGDAFLLVVRWLHLVSAAAWIGGSLFYVLVLRPALRRAPETPRTFIAGAAAEFRTVVNTCIVVLVATGVILAFDRLTVGVVAAPYVVTLGVKTALSAWMFLLVHEQRRRSEVLDAYRQPPRPAVTGLRRIGLAVSGYNALVILGIIVLFLSDFLKVFFELALGRG